MNLTTKITTKQTPPDKHGIVWWVAVLQLFNDEIPAGEVELGTLRSGMVAAGKEGEAYLKAWVQLLSVGMARIVAEVAQGESLKRGLN